MTANRRNFITGSVRAGILTAGTASLLNAASAQPAAGTTGATAGAFDLNTKDGAKLRVMPSEGGDLRVFRLDPKTTTPIPVDKGTFDLDTGGKLVVEQGGFLNAKNIQDPLALKGEFSLHVKVKAGAKTADDKFTKALDDKATKGFVLGQKDTKTTVINPQKLPNSALTEIQKNVGK